jgi:hemolysin activation/secretion protein
MKKMAPIKGANQVVTVGLALCLAAAFAQDGDKPKEAPAPESKPADPAPGAKPAEVPAEPKKLAEGELPPVPPANGDPAAPGILPLPDDWAKVPAIPGVPALPMPSAVTPKRDQVITLSQDLKPIPLRGITLIKDTRTKIKDIMSTSIVPQPGISVTGGLGDPPARAELERKLSQQFLGKQLTFGGLEDLVKMIENHYISHGRQLTHSFVPAQMMSDKVIIAILEGKITKMEALTVIPEGATWWSSWYDQPYSLKKIEKDVRAKTTGLDASQPGNLNTTLGDLNQSPWARLKRPVQHPFLKINASYSPVGDLIGETEVKLQVEQSRPLRFFLGYDNTLTDLLGGDRVYAGAIWYDAFGLNLDHQLAIQFFNGLQSDALSGLALSYQIPWKEWKQHTELYGAYSDSTVPITIGGIPSDVEGSSLVLGFKHFYELPPIVDGGEIVRGDGISRDANGKVSWLSVGKRDRQSFGIFHEIGAGLDYKSTDNNLLFGGTPVSADTADILQFVFDYNARQTDEKGETNLSWKNFLGIGGSSDAELDKLRKDAASGYYYTKIELDREQDLPYGIMAHGRLTGQYSTENLLQSEQLGVGGFSSVRGYQERIVRGDTGWLLSLEVYSPPMRPLAHFFPSLGWMDELRFLVFTDWGNGSASIEQPGDPFDDEQTLGSVGVGFRYDVNDNFRLRFDYGMQLEELPQAPAGPYAADTSDNQFHAGVVWTF